MKDFHLDTTKVVSIGFVGAGWWQYQQSLSKQGITSLGPYDILPFGVKSIYEKGYATLQIAKSAGKGKGIETVQAALTCVKEILKNLKAASSRKNIVKIILSNLTLTANYQGLKLKKDRFEDLAEDISKKEGENFWQALQDNCVSDTKTDVIPHEYEIVLSLLKELPKETFSEEPKDPTCDLSTWVYEATNGDDSLATQKSLNESKRKIFDLFQANLYLLQQNKPLIPLHINLSSYKNQIKWEPIRNKLNYKFTPAEIRALWRLLETKDPVITELLKKTVFCYEELTDGSFKQILTPEHLQEQYVLDALQERKRKSNKPPYHLRLPENKQGWMEDLISLSKDTANKLDQTISSKLTPH